MDKLKDILKICSVRRVFPELFAQKIVNIQPMRKPIGGLFTFKKKFLPFNLTQARIEFPKKLSTDNVKE